MSSKIIDIRTGKALVSPKIAPTRPYAEGFRSACYEILSTIRGFCRKDAEIPAVRQLEQKVLRLHQAAVEVSDRCKD